MCKICNKKCRKCYTKELITDKPLKETLEKDIKNLGYRGTGRKYGVSDTCIRKWLSKLKNNTT